MEQDIPLQDVVDPDFGCELEEPVMFSHEPQSPESPVGQDLEEFVIDEVQRNTVDVPASEDDENPVCH
jgi:hypothetical protein